MRVLVVGSQSLLGRAVVSALSRGHDVRTLDPPPARPGAGAYVGDLRDPAVAGAATSGCDAVVDLRLHADGHGADDLERLDEATRGTYHLLTSAKAATRLVLASSLRLFERYPASWWVTEQWAPRPSTDIDDLVCHLTEVTVRELTRVQPLKAFCLRLGVVVEPPSGASDPRWLHVHDAVDAIERALTVERPPTMHTQPPFPDPDVGWWPMHIPGGGPASRVPLALAAQEPFGYAPAYDVTGDDRIGAGRSESSALAAVGPQRQDEGVDRGAQGGTVPTRVVVFGAAGPVAVAATEALVADHVLRLTDVRPIAEVIADPPVTKMARFNPPTLRALGPPHDEQVVDVTEPWQVLEAASGMDAIVNCSVSRREPRLAFRVHVLGAYNIARAAVAAGIRRIVQTGPQQVTLPEPAGYWADMDLSADVPGRPGAQLYVLTKFLGHEILRVFAEEEGLEVPVLLYSRLIHPEAAPEEPFGAFPFSVSWRDGGDAIRRALHAPSLPRPFEQFHIVADLPHGKYRNDKAKRLLGWRPQDTLSAHWQRPHWLA